MEVNDEKVPFSKACKVINEERIAGVNMAEEEIILDMNRKAAAAKKREKKKQRKQKQEKKEHDGKSKNLKPQQEAIDSKQLEAKEEKKEEKVVKQPTRTKGIYEQIRHGNSLPIPPMPPIRGLPSPTVSAPISENSKNESDMIQLKEDEMTQDENKDPRNNNTPKREKTPFEKPQEASNPSKLSVKTSSGLVNSPTGEQEKDGWTLVGKKGSALKSSSKSGKADMSADSGQSGLSPGMASGSSPAPGSLSLRRGCGFDSPHTIQSVTISSKMTPLPAFLRTFESQDGPLPVESHQGPLVSQQFLNQSSNTSPRSSQSRTVSLTQPMTLPVYNSPLNPNAPPFLPRSNNGTPKRESAPQSYDSKFQQNIENLIGDFAEPFCTPPNVPCPPVATYGSPSSVGAITSKTKKAIWGQVTTEFNAQAESKRSSEEIQKKWDNLVQRNKAIYMDFAQNRDRTGGGEAPSKLTPLTDAVMDVIGRHSANILGIASMEMDSTMLTLDSNCVPGDSSFATLLSLPLPPTSAGYTTPTQISISSDHSIPTWTSELGQSNGIQSVIDVIPTRVSKKAASGSQVFDCRCTCHSYIEKLKVTKLELQIKKLRKELREDIGEE